MFAAPNPDRDRQRLLAELDLIAQFEPTRVAPRPAARRRPRLGFSLHLAHTH
jgi:hypothetical protein